MSSSMMASYFPIGGPKMKLESQEATCFAPLILFSKQPLQWHEYKPFSMGKMCRVSRESLETISGMLKKAASGVLALLPCSRTGSTLRAPKGLRPCWTDFFEHSRQLLMSISPRACMCHGIEIFNRPIVYVERGDAESEWRFPLLADPVEHEE